MFPDEIFYTLKCIDVGIFQLLSKYETSRGNVKFFSFLTRNELRKLSEESLTRPPEEVFDVLEKLGEG